MKKLYFVSIGFIAFALSACRGDGKPSQEVMPVKVKTMQVTLVPASGSHRFSGTVEEANGTPLSFSVMGTIRSMNVRLGDRVAKGQLVGTLDDTSARSSYVGAQATLAQAEDAYRRMKELHDKGSLPEIKWVEVQSKLEQARSMEQIARKALDDCRLTAPFGGVIASKTGEVGQNVVPGMEVAQLVTTAGQQVCIAVPEAEIGNIVNGQKAAVSVPALGGKQYAAIVTERGVTAHALSRSYEVKLRVEDADAGLLPGMVTEVSLLSPDEATAIVLPVRIVQLDEKNRQFVWTDNSGKAEKRFITCGGFVGDGVVVTQGLKAGDLVIVEGQQKVCNGTSIVNADSHEDRK